MTDYGVRVNSGLYELGYTTGTAVYVECEFHDRADLATWIIEHTTELGEAIARGVCKGAGVTYIAPSGSEPGKTESWRGSGPCPRAYPTVRTRTARAPGSRCGLCSIERLGNDTRLKKRGGF